MLKLFAVVASVSVIFAATSQAAPIRPADLGNATATAAVLSGLAIKSLNGSAMRFADVFADVDGGTAFCVGARSQCRGGAATLTFDTPLSGIDLQISRLARNSRAVVLVYRDDTLLHRVKVKNSRSLSLDLEGATHVKFVDRSRSHGMAFGVSLPMNDGRLPSLGGTSASNDLTAVPVPAGLPLMLGALAGLGLLLRRRAR